VRTLNDDRLHRDWLGHGIQVAILLVTIGGPLAYWAMATNAAVAQLGVRQERQDKDISDQRADQRLVTQNLIDVKTGFARLEATLELLRDQAKPKR
jgi:hypothetical protein